MSLSHPHITGKKLGPEVLLVCNVGYGTHFIFWLGLETTPRGWVGCFEELGYWFWWGGGQECFMFDNERALLCGRLDGTGDRAI